MLNMEYDYELDCAVRWEEGYEAGYREGYALGRAKVIRSLMTTEGLSQAQAMDALRIPLEEREECTAILARQDAEAGEQAQ